MKKALISTALASTLFLANCSSTGLSNIPAQITTVTTQTQAIAQTLCQFLPTAQTIGQIAASLFPQGAPIETVANGVATAICNAVSTHSAVKGRTPTFRGIPIHGIRTR
jgi:hypothetical protein